MRPRTAAQPATPPDLQPPARLRAAPLHPPVLTAPTPVPEPPTTPLLRPPPLMNLRPQHPRPGQVTHHPVPHLHPRIMATVPVLMAILGPAPVRMAAHQTVTVPQLMVVLARPDRTPAALADLGGIRRVFRCGLLGWGVGAHRVRGRWCGCCGCGCLSRRHYFSCHSPPQQLTLILGSSILAPRVNSVPLGVYGIPACRTILTGRDATFLSNIWLFTYEPECIRVR